MNVGVKFVQTPLDGNFALLVFALVLIFVNRFMFELVFIHLE